MVVLLAIMALTVFLYESCDGREAVLGVHSASDVSASLQWGVSAPRAERRLRLSFKAARICENDL
jgi:hypothetical protein